MNPTIRYIKQHSTLFLIAMGTLVLKLSMMTFAQEVDSDGVSRVMIADSWKSNPSWITHDIWGPLHTYILGFGLLIYDHLIHTPKIIAILFSVFTLIPFYAFTNREYGKNPAILATLSFAISPILFRNSFLALSETPFLFFLMLCLHYLSKGQQSGQLKYFIFAGISLTIASGLRYEGWLLIAILFFLVLIKKNFKASLLFGGSAMVFPLVWMFSCWKFTGDPLYGIHGNENYTLNVLQNNAAVNFENQLRRIWFFPFSLFISIGPILLFLLIKMSFSSSYEDKTNLNWSVLLWIFFAVVIYNSAVGKIILHHRFVGTITILSLPIAASYFLKMEPRKKGLALISIFLTVALSFIYNTGGIGYVPRLEDQKIVSVAEKINKSDSRQEILVLDFFGWSETYFIALHSGFDQKHMILNSGRTAPNQYNSQLREILQSKSPGIAIFKDGSEFNAVFIDLLEGQYSRNIVLETEKLDADLKLLKWRFK